MSAVVSLDALLQQRRVWKGGADIAVAPAQPTGHAQLDAVLPGGGWPEAALSELLLAHPGSGELQLLWPTLARLTRARERVVLVAPPFIPFAPAWLQAGVDLRWLVLVQASEKSGKPLTHILLTHDHPDHTANLPLLLERWPEAQVVAHSNSSIEQVTERLSLDLAGAVGSSCSAT